jgi:methylene-tetrahydromethanopterin dehydrogenase
MENPLILHLFTPAAQASPFDVNMAYDAGYDAVVPYTGVTLADVAGLTQDAIFSRGPKRVRRTGICIGGRDLDLALDMLDAARDAMVPPFAVSVLADPSGAFTTAAAVVAAIEKHLRAKHDTALTGQRVLVLGGTGPVGTAAATLAAQEGAIVELASHSALGRAQAACDRIRTRYGSSVQAVQIDVGSAAKVVARAEVLIAAAKAGVEVVSEALLREARALLVAADVNAVPPAGIAGIGAMDDGAPLAAAASGKAAGIGALAIGNIKYQVERGLFQSMCTSEKPLYLDFRHAFAKARDLMQAGR